MFESLASALHLLLSFFGTLAVAPDASAFALAVAVVAAVIAVTVALAVSRRPPGSQCGPHPRRAIDRSSPLAQSDPDAAGHARPRAPQSAASAA